MQNPFRSFIIWHIHLARFTALGKSFSLRIQNLLWQSCLMAKAPNVPWTREHFLIALNLYCKLPFGKLHKGNPIIMEVAQKMGRTPSSLAMKTFATLRHLIRFNRRVGSRDWRARRSKTKPCGPSSRIACSLGTWRGERANIARLVYERRKLKRSITSPTG